MSKVTTTSSTVDTVLLLCFITGTIITSRPFIPVESLTKPGAPYAGNGIDSAQVPQPASPIFGPLLLSVGGTMDLNKSLTRQQHYQEPGRQATTFIGSYVCD